MKKHKIITHSGSYHCDDVMAVATLSLFLGKDAVEIVRTRDEEVIKTGDYVVDVGGIYDETRYRFDHHQKEGAGVRPNGIAYASFGLVWKYCGEKVSTSSEVAQIVERKLVEPVDAVDNGIDLVDYRIPNTHLYLIQDFFRSFSPTWKEEGADVDEIFFKLVDVARDLLTREIKRAKDGVEAVRLVEEAYKNSSDKRLIILEKDWPWRQVLDKYTEPVYVVSPDRDGHWNARTVQKKLLSFENRKDFPTEWAGKKGEEFRKISGVEDAIFCHKNLFFACAESKEGTIKLAKLALEK